MRVRLRFMAGRNGRVQLCRAVHGAVTLLSTNGIARCLPPSFSTMRLTTVACAVAVAAASDRPAFTMHGDVEFVAEQPFALQTAAVGAAAAARATGPQS